MVCAGLSNTKTLDLVIKSANATDKQHAFTRSTATGSTVAHSTDSADINIGKKSSGRATRRPDDTTKRPTATSRGSTIVFVRLLFRSPHRSPPTKSTATDSADKSQTRSMAQNHRLPRQVSIRLAFDWMAKRRHLRQRHLQKNGRLIIESIKPRLVKRLEHQCCTRHCLSCIYPSFIYFISAENIGLKSVRRQRNHEYYLGLFKLF